MLHKAWNSKEEMPYCFPRSFIKFQGHTGQNITDFYPNWAFPDYRPVAAFKSLRFALFIESWPVTALCLFWYQNAVLLVSHCKGETIWWCSCTINHSFMYIRISVKMPMIVWPLIDFWCKFSHLSYKLWIIANFSFAWFFCLILYIAQLNLIIFLVHCDMSQTSFFFFF